METLKTRKHVEESTTDMDLVSISTGNESSTSVSKMVLKVSKKIVALYQVFIKYIFWQTD